MVNTSTPARSHSRDVVFARLHSKTVFFARLGRIVHLGASCVAIFGRCQRKKQNTRQLDTSCQTSRIDTRQFNNKIGITARREWTLRPETTMSTLSGILNVRWLKMTVATLSRSGSEMANDGPQLPVPESKNAKKLVTQ